MHAVFLISGGVSKLLMWHEQGTIKHVMRHITASGKHRFFFFTGNKTNEFKHSFLLLLEDATAMRSLHLEKLQLYKEKKIFALTVQDLKVV